LSTIARAHDRGAPADREVLALLADHDARAFGEGLHAHHAARLFPFEPRLLAGVTVPQHDGGGALRGGERRGEEQGPRARQLPFLRGDVDVDARDLLPVGERDGGGLRLRERGDHAGGDVRHGPRVEACAGAGARLGVDAPVVDLDPERVLPGACGDLHRRGVRAGGEHLRPGGARRERGGRDREGEDEREET
jgi:hypothetical protein